MEMSKPQYTASFYQEEFAEVTCIFDNKYSVLLSSFFILKLNLASKVKFRAHFCL